MMLLIQTHNLIDSTTTLQFDNRFKLTTATNVAALIESILSFPLLGDDTNS